VAMGVLSIATGAIVTDCSSVNTNG
jgi:hypothetical protein